ncbi:pyrroline-5-carboxylate reductase [Clostridium botulinum]|uniref:pyrroline-5-carboxylate reductase n=1 Tax=Clostridium botulinum TaxID=1491 RepID=UPI00069B4AE3|nr:pyrroline-5-carboxylate reductase [Clostridium botulinum]KOA94693.1 pyrroline-5-carboxylate reductase [Clostridium botulinum]MCD3204449.1 pyrroline-5-carboxylate reductase [Clostridium botulinum C/D]MCD3221055.1 pyrroline-5-carboxylate reductase [Clostridium botulinum C/D]MCD3231914.1 pyrroline-5-carboxylate reductase [Clostridium botulinum C/D]MCD3271828.1 pyrroline-5-carboxylate reductase [Clostridium botulinum C/D]
MNRKIGFIGCGNMGSAMIKAIVKSNLIESKNIMASDYFIEKLDSIKNEIGILVTDSNEEVAKVSDILFLSVKPNMYKDVINEIKDHIKSETIIVTIAAGVDIKTTETNFNRDVKVVRVMPNTPALVGEGMSALCPNKNLTEEELQEIVALFKCFSKVEIVEEKYINVVTALTGSSPAYVYMFIEALADGAVLKGLQRDKAYKMAAQAVLGSAKMVLETGKHPGALKDDVCSPGGTTIEAVYSLEKSGLRASVIEAIEKCVQKAEDMSK